jgi:phosphatidylglycerophosphate synthase
MERTENGSFFDAANLLTLSRLPLSALLLLRPKDRAFVLGVIAAAAVTDIFDGWFARRIPNHSLKTGAWLDPLCDKAFVLSALYAIYRISEPKPYVPALIAMREMIQAPLFLFYMASRKRLGVRVDMTAAPIGKAATVTQFLAIGSMLLRRRSTASLAVLAGVTGSAAALYYFQRAASKPGWVALSRPSEVRSIAA